MRFSLITLFPEQLENFFSQSIAARAIERGLFEIKYIQLRQFAVNSYGKVDDSLYGGGTGMLIMAEPLSRALRFAQEDFRRTNVSHNIKERLLLLSPRGQVFVQKTAESLVEYDHVILVCGHYEGVDARFIKASGIEEISVGDFVLTGGEIAAALIVDSCMRLLPSVLPDQSAWQNESHSSGLLEEAHYTRPAEWESLKVPSVLLSGNQALIDQYNHAQSLLITLENRPDILAGKKLSKADWELLIESVQQEEMENGG